ncbi:MAG: universal stress protein E [Halioglobus sp.]|jgi:universal stress protein E
MHLMRKSSVPVMILNPNQTELPKKILVPIDVSHHLEKEEFNRAIVDLAGFVAQQFDSEIHLLAVWQLEGEEVIRSSPLLNIGEERIQIMTERIENKAESSLKSLAKHMKTAFALNCEPSIHLSKGNANIVIPEFIQDHQIEMIVMGTVGRAGIPGLFIGNTAEVVLSTVDCSVLTTKPAGFVTPVAM